MTCRFLNVWGVGPLTPTWFKAQLYRVSPPLNLSLPLARAGRGSEGRPGCRVPAAHCERHSVPRGVRAPLLGALGVETRLVLPVCSERTRTRCLLPHDGFGWFLKKGQGLQLETREQWQERWEEDLF